MRIQLFQTVRGPCQMIFLFTSRFAELCARARVAGKSSLRRVKRLCTDLSHMIDPHQSRTFAPLHILQLYVRQSRRRAWTRGRGDAAYYS